MLLNEYIIKKRNKVLNELCYMDDVYYTCETSNYDKVVIDDNFVSENTISILYKQGILENFDGYHAIYNSKNLDKYLNNRINTLDIYNNLVEHLEDEKIELDKQGMFLYNNLKLEYERMDNK
jgi:hypothetical protein